MKKFFGEFKKFITRGNILDLAVGVIVGGAFTAIVTSLTNNIIRPLINWIIALIGGNQGLSSVYTFLSKAYTVDAEGKTVIDLTNSIYIDWGMFITAIVDFFIIAFVVFLIVKAVNRAREAFEELNDQDMPTNELSCMLDYLIKQGMKIKYDTIAFDIFDCDCGRLKEY